MRKRSIGRNGPQVSALGLGCMGMSEFYGVRDDAQSLATLERAFELGIDFFDTADAYGPYKNEELLGRFLRGRRDKVFIATKFGFVRDPENPMASRLSGKPEYVRQACDASLRRLGVDTIDLYYQHRVDPETPIEDTIGAMAELVKAGKVRHLGMSEAAPATLRRAYAVHPIAALQSEYSLWTRNPEHGLLAACRELGVTFVAYSPLGRGFLTGRITSVEDLPAGDLRLYLPRFQGESFASNLTLANRVQGLAREKGCSPSQLALAWVLAQGDDVIAIPGTKRCSYLEDNVGAVDITLSASELRQIHTAFPHDAAVGLRYPEAFMSTLER